jgi:hypothetical protein
MYTIEFPSSLVIDAAAELQKQMDTCEIAPQVRLTYYDRGSFDFSFICQHEDAGLNCGASARGCTRCLRKEEVYEANKNFGESLAILLPKLKP